MQGPTIRQNCLKRWCFWRQIDYIGKTSGMMGCLSFISAPIQSFTPILKMERQGLSTYENNPGTIHTPGHLLVGHNRASGCWWILPTWNETIQARNKVRTLSLALNWIFWQHWVHDGRVRQRFQHRRLTTLKMVSRAREMTEVGSVHFKKRELGDV